MNSSTPLSIAVVGAGYWGPNLVRNFARVQRGRLVAVCDLDTARLAQLKSLCTDANATTDYAALLADKSVDAIVLATPARAHFEMARAALEAGKHVYVEKPLCLSSSDAARLLELSKQRGRVLMVGHLLEYHPAVEFLLDLIERDEIGELRYLYSQRLNLGQVRADENALWSLAPHDISVANLLLGGNPQSVTASGQAFLRPDVHDVVFLTISYPGGRLAHVHVSWLDPHKTRQITLVGSKQMAVFDDMAPSEKLRLYDKGFDWQTADGVPTATFSADAETALKVRFGDVTIPHLPATEPLLLECQHFVDSINNGTTPRIDGLDGLQVVQVLEAAQQSLEQGGAPVRIAQD